MTAHRAYASLRSALGRALRRGGGNDHVDEFAKSVWVGRAEARDWLREEVLRDPLIADTMGREWAETTGARFAEGYAHAGERARLAAGPVVLQRALEKLRGDARV
jgi:hypothetical protein